MPPVTRWDDGESAFTGAVGGLLGGYDYGQSRRRANKVERQGDEDRERTMDEEDRMRAYRDLMTGFGRAGEAVGGAPAAGTPGVETVPVAVGGAMLPGGIDLNALRAQAQGGVSAGGPGGMVQPLNAPAAPGWNESAGMPPQTGGALPQNDVPPSAAEQRRRVIGAALGGARDRAGAALGGVRRGMTTGGFTPHAVDQYGVTGPDITYGRAQAAAAAEQASQRDVATIGADASRYGSKLRYDADVLGLGVQRDMLGMRYGENSTAQINATIEALGNARKFTGYEYPDEVRESASRESAFLERRLAELYGQDHTLYNTDLGIATFGHPAPYTPPYIPQGRAPMGMPSATSQAAGRLLMQRGPVDPRNLPPGAVPLGAPQGTGRSF